MMNKTLFYDTCSLLLQANNLFDNPNEKVIISNITLKELENIKTANNKDYEIKYAARKLLHTLDKNTNWDAILFTEEMADYVNGFPLTDDSKILACAIAAHILNPELIFVTNDLALKEMARLYFDNDKIISIEEEPEEYLGYKEAYLSDEELCEFYTKANSNPYGLLINEYLIIYNKDGSEVIDSGCWTGEKFRHLSYDNFNSNWFGMVKPIKNDIYQALFADSLTNNKITMVKGPAGSGKTYLSLAYLFSQLNKGNIDKIIVFCNTVATEHSAKLGYYPGSRDEKLLDSQIGNLLSSKLGDIFAVETLISQNKLVLLPLSDIRGYDTTGMRAGVYISEAQNMNISQMKLVLQRIGNDGLCIIDGDNKAQVDDNNYAGFNNGMRRASKVFKGHDIYGEVQLKTIYRSKIAEIAEGL